MAYKGTVSWHYNSFWGDNRNVNVKKEIKGKSENFGRSLIVWKILNNQNMFKF